MKKISVAIICGGPSNEYMVSLKTGLQIFNGLSRKKYNVYLIEITKNNEWIFKKGDSGISWFQKKLNKINKKEIINKTILKNFDVVFIGLHGKFGEDGKIQSILELSNIAYTGSGPLSSAIGMNKLKTIEIIKNYNILTPRLISLTSNQIKNLNKIKNIINQKIGWPCVVKPNESGSSIGVSIVKNINELKPAIKKAMEEDNIILIEKYIKGKEITCGAIGNSYQTEILVLPPVLIIPPPDKFFDYEAKYFSSQTKEICPAPISKKLTTQIQNTTRKIHYALGCDGLTRSDFIITPQNKIYFLEINTIPGLTETSLCPKEAKAIGMNFDKFLDIQIQLALLKFKNKYDKNLIFFLKNKKLITNKIPKQGAKYPTKSANICP